MYVNFCFPEIGSEQGKSVFNMLSRIKDVPSLEAQKDMMKWLLQVGHLAIGLFISNPSSFQIIFIIW